MSSIVEGSKIEDTTQRCNATTKDQLKTEAESEVEKGSMDNLVKEEEKKDEAGKKSTAAAAEAAAAEQQQDVVFIQDTGFTVKIVAPNLEPFDIQVSSMELVQEIHQLLMDRTLATGPASLCS